MAQIHDRPAVDRKARLKIPAQNIGKQAPNVRVGNWLEVYEAMDLETAKVEASAASSARPRPARGLPRAATTSRARSGSSSRAMFSAPRRSSARRATCPRCAAVSARRSASARATASSGKNAKPVRDRQARGVRRRLQRDERHRHLSSPPPRPAAASPSSAPARPASPSPRTSRRPDTRDGVRRLAASRRCPALRHPELQAREARPRRATCRTAPPARSSSSATRNRDRRRSHDRRAAARRATTLSSSRTGASIGNQLENPRARTCRGDPGDGVPRARQPAAASSCRPACASRSSVGQTSGRHRRRRHVDGLRAHGGAARRRATSRCVYRRTEAEMLGRDEERQHAREEGVRFEFLAAPVRFARRRRPRARGPNSSAWSSASRTRAAGAGRSPSRARSSTSTRTPS